VYDTGLIFLTKSNVLSFNVNTLSLRRASEGVVENAMISPVAWKSPSLPFNDHLNSSNPPNDKPTVSVVTLKNPVSVSAENLYLGLAALPSATEIEFIKIEFPLIYPDVDDCTVEPFTVITI
jgi:hypothetical protein